MPSTEPVAAERAAAERPILFSAPMVRAILEDRKAQTRRVMKPQPPVGTRSVYRPFGGELNNWQGARGDLIAWYGRCPYGQEGDRLWVRETLRPSQSQVVTYAEDGCPAWRHGESVTWPWPKTPLVRTAIFMPRWASRILLGVVEVRAQRLHDIQESDALAEGVEVKVRENGALVPFRELWDSINEKRGFGWRGNPWVWAITFKRLQV